MWHEASLFAPVEVGVQVQIPGWLLPVFFFSSFFFHRIFTLRLVPVYFLSDPFLLREIFAITYV